jgi:23S rRNA-/tRNA-specific pseudouridylate synthase
MPEVVENFEFTVWARSAGVSRYDWEKWTDGRIYCFERFKDFQCRPTGFMHQYTHHMRILGHKAQTKIVGDKVYCRVVRKLTEEEHQKVLSVEYNRKLADAMRKRKDRQQNAGDKTNA